MAAETKQWLTPKRIARGPEKADEELRRWAMHAFRPGRMRGSVNVIRAAELARRAQVAAGAPYMAARDPGVRFARVAGKVALSAGVAAAAVGIGYFAGRWWKRRQVGGHVSSSPNPYLLGVDVLAAS